ncbi:hypothetical protein N0V92_013274 [Colletotrichum tropicale]|nr:hypothetical protein N0V92_013274 [Colletotrichum tropicale]
MEIQADTNDLRAHIVSSFLLVQLLVDHLVDLSNVKEMRKALMAYPNHLEDAFESSLQRIEAQSKSHCTLAKRVMGWIISAERKLQMSELAHGLATEEGIDVIDKENLR